MSILFYRVLISEENNYGETIEHNLPHIKQISEWLPKEWDKCKIHTCFDGVLKDKVKSCSMIIEKDEENQCYAFITINFVPGFRLTEKRRHACWEQLDGQMTDGFGEAYDRKLIPNADGWRLCI